MDLSTSSAGVDPTGMTEWNKACLPCRVVHATCNGDRPCKRCLALGRPNQCVNVERKKRGRPRKNPIEGEEILEKRAHLADDPQAATAASTTASSAFPAGLNPTVQSILQSISSHTDGRISSSSNSPPSSPPEFSSPPSAEATGSTKHQHKRARNHGSDSSKQNSQAIDTALLIKEMKELRKENRSLNDKLAHFCDKVDKRLASSEEKIDSLSSSLSSGALSPAGSPPGFVSSWSSLSSSVSISSAQIRREVLRDLPFLLDYDILSESVPFLIDDLRKPFLVRRIFDPTPEEELTVPVTIYANHACCALLGTMLHEIVGAPCWFALEQPIRTYLTAKSTKPVGDIFLNAITRKLYGKRLMRLFSRNQVFYNSKGNAKWWISIIDKQEELPPASMKDCNKLAFLLNRQRRGGATISLLPKSREMDAQEDEETSRALISSPVSNSSPGTGTSPSSTSPASTSPPATTASSSSSASTSSSVVVSRAPSSTELPNFPSGVSYYVPSPSAFSATYFPQAGSSSSQASLSSLLYTSGLPSVIGSLPRADGALDLPNLGLASGGGSGAMIGRASNAGLGDQYFDQELQELWALLDPSDYREAAAPQ